MRKITRKGLIRKLDKITSQLVVARDGKCFTCGTTQNLTNGHLFTRGLYVVRWDLLNSFCLCAGCHLYWWHKHPIEAAEFTKSKLGVFEYNRLNERAQQIKKWNEHELEILLEDLTKIYETRTDDTTL